MNITFQNEKDFFSPKTSISRRKFLKKESDFRQRLEALNASLAFPVQSPNLNLKENLFTSSFLTPQNALPVTLNLPALRQEHIHFFLEEASDPFVVFLNISGSEIQLKFKDKCIFSTIELKTTQNLLNRLQQMETNFSDGLEKLNEHLARGTFIERLENQIQLFKIKDSAYLFSSPLEPRQTYLNSVRLQPSSLKKPNIHTIIGWFTPEGNGIFSAGNGCREFEEGPTHGWTFFNDLSGESIQTDLSQGFQFIDIS